MGQVGKRTWRVNREGRSGKAKGGVYANPPWSSSSQPHHERKRERERESHPVMTLLRMTVCTERHDTRTFQNYDRMLFMTCGDYANETTLSTRIQTQKRPRVDICALEVEVEALVRICT